jgi:hypothetical protein
MIGKLSKLKNNLWKKHLIVFGIVLLLVLLVANFSATIYLLAENHNNDRTLNNLYLPKISYLLERAIVQVDKPVVIDPASNNVYLPDAKLTLPPTPTSLGQVVYNYLAPSKNLPGKIQIASEAAINDADASILTGVNLGAIFNAVPRAQACARGVSIYFNKLSGQQSVFSKKLTDGQTAYFYTEPLCQNNDFLSYLEKINSY